MRAVSIASRFVAIGFCTVDSGIPISQALNFSNLSRLPTRTKSRSLATLLIRTLYFFQRSLRFLETLGVRKYRDSTLVYEEDQASSAEVTRGNQPTTLLRPHPQTLSYVFGSNSLKRQVLLRALIM